VNLPAIIDDLMIAQTQLQMPRPSAVGEQFKSVGGRWRKKA
jgi:hypothetical protein